MRTLTPSDPDPSRRHFARETEDAALRVFPQTPDRSSP